LKSDVEQGLVGKEGLKSGNITPNKIKKATTLTTSEGSPQKQGALSINTRLGFEDKRE